MLEADEGVDGVEGDGGGVGLVEGEFGEFVVETLEVGADEVGEVLGGGGVDGFVVAFVGAAGDPGGDLGVLEGVAAADGAEFVESLVDAGGFEPGVEDEDEGGFGGGGDVVFEDFAVGEAVVVVGFVVFLKRGSAGSTTTSFLGANMEGMRASSRMMAMAAEPREAGSRRMRPMPGSSWAKSSDWISARCWLRR